MRTITKLRRNSRALSPIFATLILIAIAVIAGIVVYMFTSGFLSGNLGTSNPANEKIAVQTVSMNAAGDVTMYFQVQGGTPTISNLLVKDSGNNVVGTPITTFTVNDGTADVTGALTGGKLYSLVILTGAMPTTLTAGAPYSIVMITAAGNQITSQSFVAS